MDKPAGLLEAEERLWTSVVAGMEIDLGNRVPSVRAGGGRRKQIRADGSGRVVVLALREIPYSKRRICSIRPLLLFPGGRVHQACTNTCPELSALYCSFATSRPSAMSR